MADAYADWQANRVKVGPVQAAVERVYGGEKDEQLDRVRQALQVGYPGLAPSDALGYIGSERLLPRAAAETTDDYAERLRTVWEGLAGWSYAGSHGSLLRALERAGFPMGTPDGCHVVQRVRRYSYLDGADVVYGTHAGMTWDSRPANIWNQFVLIFGADVAGLSEGTTLADILNRTVRQWKPAKARFMGTYVVVTAPVWGWPPETEWGQAGLDWGESESRFVPPL